MNRKQIGPLVFILIGFIFLTSSCIDSDGCARETYTSPQPFMLKIVDEEGTNLINYDVLHPDSIQMFYEAELGNTIVDIYFQKVIDGNVLISSELPTTILETANNTFYLYLNSTDIDTLHVDVKQGSDACNVWYYYIDCSYNQEEMEIDQASYFFIGVK